MEQIPVFLLDRRRHVGRSIGCASLGRLIDRRGVRPVVLTGAFLVGVIELALGFQTASLWLFYLLFTMLGVVGAIAAGSGRSWVLCSRSIGAKPFGRYRYTTDFKAIPEPGNAIEPLPVNAD